MSPSAFCSLLQNLVNLFARLANDNIGYVNWDPYIPKVLSCLYILRLKFLGLKEVSCAHQGNHLLKTSGFPFEYILNCILLL